LTILIPLNRLNFLIWTFCMVFDYLAFFEKTVFDSKWPTSKMSQFHKNGPIHKWPNLEIAQLQKWSIQKWPNCKNGPIQKWSNSKMTQFKYGSIQIKMVIFTSKYWKKVYCQRVLNFQKYFKPLYSTFYFRFGSKKKERFGGNPKWTRRRFFGSIISSWPHYIIVAHLK